MSTKKDSGSVGLASYLSSSDLQKAVRLKNEIKSAKKVEDILRYQKQLAVLMAKAERNKRQQERMVRRRERAVRSQALHMKRLDRQKIIERYAGGESESPGMLVVGKGLVEGDTEKVAGKHYTFKEGAVAGARGQAISGMPKRYTIKSHSESEKKG